MLNVSVSPITDQAIKLFHDGCLTLSEIEENGILIDLDYCKRQYKALTNKIRKLRKLISKEDVVKTWKRVYGKDFNINSNAQLAYIIFDYYKEPVIKETETGAPAVDKEVLHKLSKKYRFLKYLEKLRKLLKARDTYLKNIIEETSDKGLLHPIFNLHTVVTFRSSSSNPNFQNIPIRDPYVKRVIRRAFIPREGHTFGGIDYGGSEVKIACCYHKDPVMMKYLKGAGDMHRDVAADCYKTTPDMVSKDMRYCGKNKFTFPQFYGDYYRNCAVGLWEAIDDMDLKMTDGTPVKEHLKKEGITCLDDFIEHVRNVEDIFWNKRFKVYAQWKEQWLEDYWKNGYFDMYTGFRCQGVMGKNDVINYPVQGASFHCLLWSLIRLHAWMKENKLKSKIVGQIHDEIVLDMYIPEAKDILLKAKEIMVNEIVKEWKWIIVPLEVDAAFCPPGKSWADKETVFEYIGSKDEVTWSGWLKEYLGGGKIKC